MSTGRFSERLSAVPDRPGVYLMKDANGKVLYVGKASVLRNRIRSYFQKSAGLSPKIRRMVSRVEDFEFIVTESDQEAFLLESNLIKRHKPHFNARLKDDKSYPFIKIDTTEDFPQVYITRKVKDDGARYFGPYASAGSVRRTLALLKKLFPYRSCTKVITGNDERPCLDYHIHRCVGPCIGAIDKFGYSEVIDQVILFMEGRTDRVTRTIRRRMHEAANCLEFERAAVLRDQLTAIERVQEGQKVLHISSESVDVVASATLSNESLVEVFFIRQGKLIGRDNFLMEGTADEEPGQTLSSFLRQFYAANPYVPRTVLTPCSPDEQEAIEVWLTKRREGRVQIRVPKRGEKRRLVAMVQENAESGLEQLKLKQSSTTNFQEALEELQEALNLPRPPRRIECYDISNIQGTDPVGSMIVFEDGKARKADYRRFRIKGVTGVDDYLMMREVLSRRFRRYQRREEGSEAWTKHPDLVLIDGGKGHLGAALQVFLELGIDTVPLASLAKENEELFVPHTPEPITLSRNSPALFLVQRARDEAHRFAVTFHRQRRSKGSVKSAMDLVPGIGPKRRKLLLRRFGSVAAVRDASLEDIAAVSGMTVTLARKVKEYL